MFFEDVLRRQVVNPACGLLQNLVVMMFFRFLVIIFALLFMNCSYALDSVEIGESFERMTLGKNLEVHQADSRYKTPFQIRDSKNWKASHISDINYNAPNEELWVRFRLENTLNTEQKVYLQFGNNFLDSAEVYQIDNVRRRFENSWTFMRTDRVLDREVPSSRFVVPVELRPKASTDIYLKIKNAHSAYIPVRLYSKKVYDLKDIISQIFVGALIGIILVVSIFSFVMYILIKEKRFLSYACFSLSLLILIAFLSGLITMFWSFPQELNVHQMYYFVSCIFYVALLISFYEMYIHLDIVRKLSRHSFIYLLYPIVMMVACWFLPTEISVYSNLAYLLFCLSTCFYVLQNKWSKISNYQRIYGITLLIFLVCWLGNCLSRFGVLYLPLLSDEVLFYFAIIASFSLSFALVYRAYIEKQSRIYAGNVHKHHSKRFIDLYQQAEEGFFSIDLDGKLLDANKAFFNLFGYENIDDFRINCGPSIVGVYSDVEESNKLLSDVILAGQEDGIKRELSLTRRDGSKFTAQVSLRLFERSEDVKSNHVLEGIILDISEIREIKSRIDYLMNHDVVTNLHNRSFMQKRVEKLSEEAGTYKANCHDYFLFVDIDHFKVINNSCGSIAGDSFLQIVGQTLQEVVPDDDVARIGGDEFGIVVSNCYVDHAIGIAEKIRSSLQKLRFEWNKNYYSITASIGIVPCETIDTSAILSLAETACGAAKLQGRNRVYLYSELSDDVLNYKKEIGWVAQIYKAIEQNKFILFKQRILTFVNDERLAYEVFVRLLGDNGNILPASTFIGAAKKFGLISHIDSWVVESLHSWLDTQNIDEIEAVFINMSLSSISSLHTHRKLKRLFEKSSYPLNKLCFEISENSMRDNSANVRDFVKLIRSFNCQLALDHFECGIGSFALIEQVKPNYLKIDCETLIGLERLGGESVIRELQKELKKYTLKIVIMHIKNEEMYNIIKKYNFDAYQGFGIERPLPISLNGSQD